MYVLLDPRSFSISLAKSLDISSDAMFANVHNANPTAYMFEWFMSLQTQCVKPQGFDWENIRTFLKNSWPRSAPPASRRVATWYQDTLIFYRWIWDSQPVSSTRFVQSEREILAYEYRATLQCCCAAHSSLPLGRRLGSRRIPAGSERVHLLPSTGCLSLVERSHWLICPTLHDRIPLIRATQNQFSYMCINAFVQVVHL